MKKKKKEEEIWSLAFWGSEIGMGSSVEWFRSSRIMNDPKSSDLAVLAKDGGEGFNGGVLTEAVDEDLAVGGVHIGELTHDFNQVWVLAHSLLDQSHEMVLHERPRSFSTSSSSSSSVAGFVFVAFVFG